MNRTTYALSASEEQELRERIARLSRWHMRAMTAGQPERARCAAVGIRIARRAMNGTERRAPV